LLGLAVCAFEFAKHVIAGEPLPDASMVAYKASKQPKQPAQPKPSAVTLTGVIEAVKSDGLKIKAGKTSISKNQQEWLVFAQSDSTAFTIRGTATPDYMRKGQTVEFSGQFVTNEKDVNKVNEGKVADTVKEETVADTGKEGKVADKVKEEKIADKVKELTIFSRKVAAVNKGGAKDRVTNPGRNSRSGTSKAKTDSQTTVTKPDDSKAKTGDDAAPATKVAIIGGKARIVGRIESCDGKSLTVTAGQRTIHADLADIPTITVELSNPIFVPDGKDGSNNKVEGTGASGKLVTMMASDLIKAKIVVHGMGLESDSDRRCAAKSIDVTLATPLTGKKPASPEAKNVADQK
ncbi:MAG: hypothetical protein ACLP9L_38270, partial [Thermoguttaceae bacterium]